MHVSLTLVGLPNAVAFAREFTRSSLHRMPFPDVVDNAELLVSELVTNAVEAGGLTMTTPVSAISRWHFIHLAISVQGGQLLIEVWDAGNGTPSRKPVHPDAENGRGLFLVEMLSQRWGVVPSPHHGKTVWCMLALAAAGPAEHQAAEASPPSATPLPLPRRTMPHGYTPPPSNIPHRTSPLGMEDMEHVLAGLARL
ncbi:ATP-binding protein [Nocardiopsis lambiniae]|uniref:ATP-binding protein n=1 Tax=Nocardiopsis lambiniae TaxID=3075539 RepID=A0ABU2ME76_9ACTN|nr:ATP-binding protein [Nocardiopsis sp. DSM 44743]MDT0330883.1 ATP-binding protein [Nocardiopsis sp. DSM 44743]